MKIFKQIILIFALVITKQCFSQKQYDIIDTQQFFETIYTGESKILIDVQPLKDFNKQHIKDFINLDTKKALNQYSDTINKNTVILMYCFTDVRSKSAAQLLADKGFKYIYILNGGLEKWINEGLPLINNE